MASRMGLVKGIVVNGFDIGVFGFWEAFGLSLNHTYGKFDTRSYYNNIQGASASNFLWKGVWKVKISKRVAFFVWIAVHGQILTLDNLMLRGRILVNWCCMCHHNEETVDHLLLHCPVAHSLWVYMYQIFGIQWVMPGSVESLVYS